ncbi:DUF4342 domain-containing protein [Thermosediminibacter oceani]|uniref:Ubiquitin-associated-domain-containing protein n=1 Tax=Thermosediminibacter oceani (strain ATCC BAA-1034 / DSM 16646 / JW/IW-1228P) TaxID=555079 RepID=D9RZ25_THEOJ|nr:DUF4342 domain-containing protein [Thermosediminibacter oceani]ADL08579.1 ubiquitin-associated- domain-containing protein [Thermosediminibacter oceani DSM 16646]
MEIDLQKIDILRERTGCTYRKAKEALEAAGGDVVKALIILEEEQKEGFKLEDLGTKGSMLLEKIKELIRKGNVTRLRIKQGDRVLLEIPVTVGAIGAILAPYLAAIGVIAALVTRCTIQIEKENGEKEEIVFENRQSDKDS